MFTEGGVSKWSNLGPKQKFHRWECRPMRVLLNHHCSVLCTAYTVKISSGSCCTTKELFEIETTGHSDRPQTHCDRHELAGEPHTKLPRLANLRGDV